MGGQHDLHVRIQFDTQVDEPFLPLDMQTHLGLVHKQHVGQIILYEHRQQDGQYLFLAARQLIRHQRLTDLRESYLVLCPHDLLASLRKQVVHDILETALLLRQLLGGIGMALLQLFDDTVADVHLIVQILALQVIELEIEGRADTGIHHVQGLVVEHGRVERTDNVEAYMRGVGRFHLDAHTLQQVVDDVAVGVHTLDHLVQDGALTHTVDTAQDVYLTVQFPHHVFLPAPERVDLYPTDIISILLHSPQVFMGQKYTKKPKVQNFRFIIC